MRTTLTLDDDNAVRLERLRKARDSSLKEVVNETIRRGLDEIDATPKRREPFRTKVLDLGTPLYQSPEELKNLIAEIDQDDDRRKTGPA